MVRLDDGTRVRLGALVPAFVLPFRYLVRHPDDGPDTHGRNANAKRNERMVSFHRHTRRIFRPIRNHRTNGIRRDAGAPRTDYMGGRTMNGNGMWFGRFRAIGWEDCESCGNAIGTQDVFRLESDANGAFVCMECASEFGRIRNA